MNKEERENIEKTRIKWRKKTMTAKNIMKEIFNENSGTFYFYDRPDNRLHPMKQKVQRLRGGFTTRSDAERLGEFPTSFKELNNGVVTRTYKALPSNKVWIDGSNGGCCVIACYYLNAEIREDMVGVFLQRYHEHLQIDASASIAVTDGTFDIIKRMNDRLKHSVFRKMYPTPALPRILENVNTLFGDSNETGKFLVQICEREGKFGDNISHFVSLDTHAMEIYDPMCKEGAIAMYRNSTDHCVILEMLNRNPKECSITTIWRLEGKVHGSGMKRDSSNGPAMDMSEVQQKKKKITRKIRIKKHNNN